MGRSPASFAVGDEVEVICQDEGFRGALYEARIVRSATKQMRYTIEYETLMSDADPEKSLRETVGAAHVRPRPLPIRRSSFEIGDKVDAFHNDGWWAGEISKVLEGGKSYAVRFTDGDEGSKEELEYGLDEIRVHMDWMDGQWISPKAQVQDKFAIQQNLCGTEPEAIRRLLHAISIAHEAQIPLRRSMLGDGADENPSKPHYSAAILDSVSSGESTLQVHIGSSHPCEKSENGEKMLGRELRKGDMVEVCSDDEGLCGAWYSATIVESNGKDFCVEYQNLRTDDYATLLTETVDSLHIRPIPPVAPVFYKFKLLEEVDAFHNDGWWVGIISKVLEGSRYMVYFKTWNEEIEFGQRDLRLHHEWIDGKWRHVSEALHL